MKIIFIILGIVLFIFFLTKFVIGKESEDEYMQEQLNARDYWRWKHGGID